MEQNANAALQDKGGLIPLHNAASYGVSILQKLKEIEDYNLMFIFKHVEMAALILKYNPNVINMCDKWGYTSLHEYAFFKF